MMAEFQAARVGVGVPHILPRLTKEAGLRAPRGEVGAPPPRPGPIPTPESGQLLGAVRGDAPGRRESRGGKSLGFKSCPALDWL